MQTDQADPINSCRDITDWLADVKTRNVGFVLRPGPDLVCLFDDGKSESDQCLLLSPGHNLMSTTQAGADQGSE